MSNITNETNTYTQMDKAIERIEIRLESHMYGGQMVLINLIVQD